MDGCSLRPMTIEDYPAVTALWAATEGMGLSADDSQPAIERFLRRNPGLSVVAVDALGELAGAVLCGHDGRRGLLHHLAVRRDLRGCGLGSALVQRAVENLRGEGIRRCHLMVMRSNTGGLAFWQRVGWRLRDDLYLMTGDVL